MQDTKTQEFIEKARVRNDKVEIIGKYIKSNVKIDCKCKICGGTFSMTPSHILGGQIHRDCRLKINGKNHRKTNEGFLEELNKINPNIFPLERYQVSSKKIKLKCLICGNEWYSTPNTLLSQKEGCPNCAQKIRAQKNTKTNEDFLKELNVVNSNIVPLEEYSGICKKIKFKCLICNNEWYSTPNNLLHNKGCPNCKKIILSKLKMKSKEDFQKELKENYCTSELIGEYKGRKKTALFKCKICNHEFTAIAENVLKSTAACSYCSASIGEKRIWQWLLDNNINFNFQKTFNGCLYKSKLRFDFYLPDYNLCIEYNGKQHYETVNFDGDYSENGIRQAKENLKEQIIKDNIKRDFCKQNNIKLLTITYHDKNHIEKILNRTVTTAGNI